MSSGSYPVSTPVQAVHSLRALLRECYPAVGPAPDEEEWLAHLRDMGAGEAVLEEARRCWRALLPSEALSPALAYRVPPVRHEELDAALLEASGLAALRHLCRLLPERFPGGQRFTFMQALMLLLHECHAAGEPLAVALKRLKLALFGRPDEAHEFEPWFAQATRAEAVEALAYAASHHHEETP